jgi:hypothetical protein
MRPCVNKFYQSNLLGVLLENGDLWVMADGDFEPAHSRRVGKMLKFIHEDVADFGVDYDLIVVLLKNGNLYYQKFGGELVHESVGVRAMDFEHEKEKFSYLCENGDFVTLSYDPEIKLVQRKNLVGPSSFFCVGDSYVFVREDGNRVVCGNLKMCRGAKHLIGITNFWYSFNTTGLMFKPVKSEGEVDEDMLKIFDWCQFGYVDGDKEEVPEKFERHGGRHLLNIFASATSDDGVTAICFRFADFSFTYTDVLNVYSTVNSEYILPFEGEFATYNRHVNIVDVPEIQEVLSHRILKFGDFDIPRHVQITPLNFLSCHEDVEDTVRVFWLIIYRGFKLRMPMPKPLCWYIINLAFGGF